MFDIRVQQWDDHISAWVTSKDGKSSCRIQVYDYEPTVAYISDLFVDPNQRCNGIGSAIMNYCEDRARFWGCTKITLKSETNDFTRDWYKKIGYNEVDTHVWFEKII